MVRLQYRYVQNHKRFGLNMKALYVLAPLSTPIFFTVLLLLVRWVSVVEFHDQALSIGKVFGQESTVVKWNYQILGLHQVTVRQKLGVILVIKWFWNWSQQKMIFTKKVRLNWYSSMKFFFRKIRMIFDIENSLWKSKIGTFWRTVSGWRHKIW